VRLELKGRVGNFDILAEDDEAQPLIGQIVLERLDLIIEPITRRLIPNLRSPEMPMIEVFTATSPNSRHTATLRCDEETSKKDQGFECNSRRS